MSPESLEKADESEVREKDVSHLENHVAFIQGLSYVLKLIIFLVEPFLDLSMMSCQAGLVVARTEVSPK